MGNKCVCIWVVLFELLSGRLAIDLSNGKESSLIRWAQKCVKERKFDLMVDANIKGTIYVKCLARFAKIAYRCLHSDLKERLTMTEVVASLKKLQQIQKKWDNAAKSSITTVFSWMIPKFRNSTKENQGMDSLHYIVLYAYSFIA
ncbi:putative non-specific serine/threonine protein kinase [Helianthus annuus]|nr:putative non-specific serine/threonine protein kinase [Helianthus annuus]